MSFAAPANCRVGVTDNESAWWRSVGSALRMVSDNFFGGGKKALWPVFFPVGFEPREAVIGLLLRVRDYSDVVAFAQYFDNPGMPARTIHRWLISFAAREGWFHVYLREPYPAASHRRPIQ